MSTLFFDLMSQFDDDPDWSTSSITWDEEKLAKAYECKLGIGKKSKYQVEDYSWLKPPEDWNKNGGK